METHEKVTVLGICCVIGIITILRIAEIQWQHKLESFEKNLAHRGVTTQKGLIRSPAVIIEVEKTLDFLYKIDELKQSTVYYQVGPSLFSREYYVFTSDFNIAYRYELGGGDDK